MCSRWQRRLSPLLLSSTRGSAARSGAEGCWLRKEMQLTGEVLLCSNRWTHKLQAQVYDNLPSTTAVSSYAIGSRKLSAKDQFFVVAETLVSLLQTTQIKQGVSFIAANKVCISKNKTTIVSIETELFFLPGVDASRVYVRAWALGCFYSHTSTQNPSTCLRHPSFNHCRI